MPRCLLAMYGWIRVCLSQAWTLNSLPIPPSNKRLAFSPLGAFLLALFISCGTANAQNIGACPECDLLQREVEAKQAVYEDNRQKLLTLDLLHQQKRITPQEQRERTQRKADKKRLDAEIKAKLDELEACLKRCQEKTALPPQCSGEGCEAFCFGPGCGAACSGQNCEAYCFGAGCDTACNGPGCNLNCVGDECTGSCFGDDCDSSCYGPDCGTFCSGGDCGSTCLGGECDTSCVGDECRSACDGPGCESSCSGARCTSSLGTPGAAQTGDDCPDCNKAADALARAQDQLADGQSAHAYLTYTSLPKASEELEELYKEYRNDPGLAGAIASQELTVQNLQRERDAQGDANARYQAEVDDRTEALAKCHEACKKKGGGGEGDSTIGGIPGTPIDGITPPSTAGGGAAATGDSGLAVDTFGPSAEPGSIQDFVNKARPVVPESDDDISGIAAAAQARLGSFQNCTEVPCPVIDCAAAAALLQALVSAEAYMDGMYGALLQADHDAHAHFNNLVAQSVMTGEMLAQAQDALALQEYLHKIGSLLLDIASITDFWQKAASGKMAKESAFWQVDSVLSMLKNQESVLNTLLGESQKGPVGSIPVLSSTEKSNITDAIKAIKKIREEIKAGKETAEALRSAGPNVLKILGRAAKWYSQKKIDEQKAHIDEQIRNLGAESVALSAFFKESQRIVARKFAAQDALAAIRAARAALEACMAKAKCGSVSLSRPSIPKFASWGPALTYFNTQMAAIEESLQRALE
ncbi:MAG: hypothetical protein ACREUA_06105, partial [Burkholderiales bacterium]